MNAQKIDWSLDFGQLDSDREKYIGENHAVEILTEIPKLTRENFRFGPGVLSAFEESQKYLDSIRTIVCGARHEAVFEDALLCKQRRHNIVCTHNLDFNRYDDVEELRSGNRFFGVEFFAIPYVLYQKGFVELSWYLDNAEFEKLQSEFFDHDSPPSLSHFFSGKKPKCLECNPDTQEFQRRMGPIMIEKFVKPVQEAMNQFVTEQGIILDTPRKIIPIKGIS